MKKLKDHNMYLVGLGNTRILTDYVENLLGLRFGQHYTKHCI